MDAACLDHLLTSAERDAFERDGYVVLPGVLDRDEVDRHLELADRYDEQFRASDDVDQYHPLNLHDLVGREDDYLDLVDWPRTFPKVFGVMGWHIQLFHTQLVVTPPMPKEAPPGGYGWHQDNNRMNRDFETAVHPRVSVKLGYFLSDIPEPGMGNFCVVPGSHTTQELTYADGARQPEGAVEVTGQAGDAVFFDRRIWHSASTNLSDVTRKVLFYGYSYRWLRPKSAMDFDPAFFEQLDPVRRQLLGWASSQNGYFDPQPDDVPLRGWIREHLGEDAVAA